MLNELLVGNSLQNALNKRTNFLFSMFIHSGSSEKTIPYLSNEYLPYETISVESIWKKARKISTWRKRLVMMMALAGKIWRRQTCDHVWWSAHWNDSAEIDWHVTQRQWIDECTCWGRGSFTWHSRFISFSLKCNSNTPSISDNSKLFAPANEGCIYCLQGGDAC